MEKVIEFRPDGKVTSLHQEAFNLRFLGAQKITRATDIVFNEATQLWNIRVLGRGYDWSASYLSRFESYETAREFEVEWINHCMEVGADWQGGSSLARSLALTLRGKYTEG